MHVFIGLEALLTSEKNLFSTAQDSASVHYALATRLRLVGQWVEAIEALRAVLRQQPRHVGALLDIGGLLMLQARMEIAKVCFERLLRLQPRHPLALYNLAQTLQSLGQPEAALLHFQAAVEAEPGNTSMCYHLENQRLGLCDWQDYDCRMALIEKQVNAYLQQPNAAALPPLVPLLLLGCPLPAALFCQLAQSYAHSLRHAAPSLPGEKSSLRPRPSPNRIRIGYLSADFCSHAMGMLVHGVFKHHDRAVFEVFGYSLRSMAGNTDIYSTAVQAGVDHFCDVSQDSAAAIAQRIRADGIDVLIDLMGYTTQSRPEVLALRAAPVQLHYLGNPGPIAADFVDGLIADDALIPPYLEAYYGGPVLRLPCAFVWSAPPGAIASPEPPEPPEPSQPKTRADHGLPLHGVVYACLSRPVKLDPHTFGLWMQVLQAVPGSVLWLVINAAPLLVQRLRGQAQAHGVAGSRLVFSAPVPMTEFAHLCSLADLLLDTAHYNLGATGVMALRAGLPLLTCPGEGFAARMGASLCTATGLHGLICTSAEGYKSKAIELGLNPFALAGLRRNLLEQGDTLLLFQTAAWVRSLEALILPLSLKPPVKTMPLPVSAATATATSSPGLADWLHQQDVSLAFSTYRANRLIFLGRSSDGQRLALHERLFDRPMGLFVQKGHTVESLWMAGRSQVWRLDNLLEPGQLYEGGDRLFVPAACFTTGEVNAHEIVVAADSQGGSAIGEPLFVNTAFSCLARLQPGCSFAPVWQPPFVKKLTPDDRCHLNGLALVDGIPTWATACGSSDKPAGWRDQRAGGGVLLHIPSNRIAATGLTMPHSPRWHGGKVWLLNSGTGELGFIEGEGFKPVCFLPGFARGLAFVGEGAGSCAVVGLSKLRSPQFTGLPLEQSLHELNQPGGYCGLRVIDLTTGKVIHTLDLPEPIDELFDVVALHGVRQPRALGLQSEDIHCLVKLPGQPQLTTIRPKAPSGNPHQAKPPPVFGLPVALAEALPIRYQQVFQLTPQTLAPYAALTFPSLMPGTAALAQLAGQLLAVSAMAGGVMVGLAVAERQGVAGAALVSLMVQSGFRRQGIATRMVQELQRFLAQQGVQNIALQNWQQASIARIV